jgi:hypothetical protein
VMAVYMPMPKFHSNACHSTETMAVEFNKIDALRIPHSHSIISNGLKPA